MKFHPLCELFPVMTDDELDALGRDIESNGQHQPIYVFEGMILDGRNRWLACERVGVKPNTMEVEPDDALSFVCSLNLNRRQLTTSQRAMVTSEIAKLGRGRPKSNPQVCGLTTEEAAEKMKVSTRSVEAARSVRKRGTEGLTRAVIAGKVSLNQATAISKLPKREQAAVLAKGPEEVARVAATLKRPPRGGLYAEKLASEQDESNNLPAGGAGSGIVVAQSSAGLVAIGTPVIAKSSNGCSCKSRLILALDALWAQLTSPHASGMAPGSGGKMVIEKVKALVEKELH